MKKSNRKRSCFRIILIGAAGLIGLCMGLALVSAFVNSRMPTRSDVVDRLSPAQKARIQEVFHLRESLGDQIMPGFSQADIPVVVYNEEYAFVVGLADPQVGWKKIPDGPQRGGPWQAVQDDEFYGQTYYRQRLPNSDTTPEAFTVQIGDRWAASLSTYEWMRIQLAQQWQEELPGMLRPVFPYPLVVNFFLGGSDFYVTALSHEAMHAYQGIQAAQRLAEGENAQRQFERSYPWDEDTFHANWQSELDCLRDAAQSSDVAETQQLAQKFLALREARRQAASLSEDHIDLERKREWEEGIAKYAELSAYRLAAEAPGYVHTPELLNDPQFKQYRGFEQRWKNEINQIALSIQSEDIRFYYSGMAQAVLLDRLMPSWKERLFEEGIWLEDLLAEAVLD